MSRLFSRIAGLDSGRASRCAIATLMALGVLGAAPAVAQEIVVTIESVRALDRIDLGPGGKADFFAVVTIDGKSVKSPVIRRAESIKPNWRLAIPVNPGTHDVKLELYDQDVLSKPDPIDINRLPNKRDLDFRVNTRSCTITGFAQEYDCRRVITRGGDQKKAAEISFHVNVRR